MEATTSNEELIISPSSGKPIAIEIKKLKEAAMVLRAIKNPLRQTILALLNEQKRMDVTGIYTRLNLEQSVASQQLAILRRAGIVKTEREGKSIFYSINKSRLSEIERLINELA